MFTPREDPPYTPLVPKLVSHQNLPDPDQGSPTHAGSVVSSAAEELQLGRTLVNLQRRESELLGRIEELHELFEARKRPIVKQLEEVRAQAVQQALQLDALTTRHTAEGPLPGPKSLRWVEGDLFTLACMVVIIANLVVMMLELRNKDHAFWLLDQVFLVWYLLEVSLKAVLHQRGFLFGPCTMDRAFRWMDLLIVMGGIVDQWVLPLVTFKSGSGKKGLLGFNTSGLRALRILRVTRIMRLCKAIKLLLHMDFSWADGNRFESFIMGVILVNAVTMGLELDLQWDGFHWLNLVMLLIYLFEIIVRIKHHKWMFFTNQNWFWNNLDFFIVIGGCVEQLGMPLYDAAMVLLFNHSHTSAHPVLSLLRIFRLARVARLYRLLTMFKALKKLVLGIADAMQGTIWVIILTFLVLYIFAIIFTTLVGHGVVFGGETPIEATETFGTVEMSLYTLFKLMNDDQSVVQFTNSVWVKLLFMFSMVVLNWVMLATLTSVVTDHMNTSTMRSERDEERRESEHRRARSQSRLKNLFQEIDTDGNGLVEREEFAQLLVREDMREELVQASGLKEQDLMELFEYLSHDDHEGRRVMDYEEFIEKMQMEAKPASERTVFRLEESMRAMEKRTEKRFQNLMRLLQQPRTSRNSAQDDFLVPLPGPSDKRRSMESLKVKLCPPDTEICIESAGGTSPADATPRQP